MAIKFFLPDFIGDVSWLTFGVIRPAHVNGVLFGFVSSGLLGAMFYIVPRLCAVPLFRPRLAMLAAVLWNGAILGGIIWILLGGSQGREYAELPWAIDVAVIATLLLMGYIVFGTILRRKEKKLYVSLWYYMGTMLWFPIVYFIGNVMWHPSTGALNGIQDAIFNWYYGHNVLGLWFTTLGIPAWYYFVPKLINRPLYSHLLSLIAFFTIAFFYTGVGSHHLLQAPLPEWLKTVAVIMSILMIVPVITFATNIFLTLRGSWHKLITNFPLMFIMAGLVMYVLASIQGSFQALRDANMFTHFSQWPVGHAHLALLGGFGFLAAGAAYYIVPRLLKFKVFSNSITRLSFWVLFVGFFFFFLAMTIAGLVANSDWWVHINVVETLVALKIPFIFRAMAGGVVVLGAFIFAYNILMTFIRSRQPHQEEEHEPAEAMTALKHSEFMRRSQEKINVPIITIGGMVVFIIMTFMVVAMPYMFTTEAPSDRAHVLTAQEQQGEDLYRANGCFYCHNQFVRPQDWAMGVTSVNGDFYYSIPNFMGTERTGPSLGQIGGKRPTEWHIMHHEDPRSVSPSSIMPPFGFLSEDDLTALADYLQNLGSENLVTNSFQPPIPTEYQDKTNPYLPMMAQVNTFYNADNQTFSGSDALATQWGDLFDEGKQLFIEKCLSCHGGSGNGQGPYARQVVTRPANLHERLINYPEPQNTFQFWRMSAGVPGTAMPPWGLSLSEDTIWKIATYELSFKEGALRSISGDISDAEGDNYNNTVLSAPPISGTKEQYDMGHQLYLLYCTQCHGNDGHGDGPASSKTADGYIAPEPANFEESGNDFTNYGRWVWKVREGVETTNMPPWRYALSNDEIYRLVFYIQGFSTADNYIAKWGPLYTDSFGRNLKGQ
jgi:cytochrome c oxidase cbb3-type subunit I/II